ncbi:MAG TPA: S41 family peptidase, partial [Bacteroidia bacterium]|nr:S41 family peptidase [Bacteroidia bacterium]
ISSSSLSQVDKYKPFKLVIISPDSAVIDTSLKANGDTLEQRYLRYYYNSIKLAEEELKKMHAKDSTLKKHYIEGEDKINAFLEDKKKLEKAARGFKYYQTISEFSALVYDYYFNEYPPYSTFQLIPKSNLAVQNLSHISDSLRADYVIGFKNIHTEIQNRHFFLKLTTILYSKKENKILFEKETSGDDINSWDGMWTCMNPLSCLLKYAVKSSSEKVFEVLRKRQLATIRKEYDDLKGRYPILNKTLDLLKRYHINNYSEESLGILLLHRIDSVFQLGLKIVKEKDELEAYYNGRKFSLSDRKSLLNLCDLIEPHIQSLFSKQHFETDYDYYLADLLIFKINNLSYLTSKETVNYYNNCMDITIDKNNNFIIYDECLDSDHNTIKSGSVITEINNTPIKYFTYGTLKRFLYKNRNSTITMRLKEDSEPRYMELKNCDVKRPQGFEYMIDLKGNCYIKINSYLKHEVTNILWEKLTADCDSIKSITIDLRNQRGGMVKEAIDLANLFTKQGLLLAEVITKGPDTTKFISLNYNKCENRPMYVYINGLTTGSGEIIAAILKEYRSAILIGEKTMSNVNVQASYWLSNNYYIRISLGALKTADKYLLSEDPILPDISFDSPEYENLKLNDFR